MATTVSMDALDMIVVGAGITGIIAAQRYLDAHPDCKLTLLEKDACIGGVFSRRRLYDEFWTQWHLDIAEYSDLPMERPPEDDCRYETFRAKYTTQYLERYVDEKQTNNLTLRQRIRFGVEVQKIEKSGQEWMLTCQSKDKPFKLSAARLMIAIGESNVKNWPYLPGKENFKGSIVHSEDFGSSNVIADKDQQHFTVIGGGKSSVDMVYEALRAKKTVSWIVRSGGFFVPIDMPTPYKNAGHTAHTRIMASLQPSILLQETWWTWFLQRTRVGRGLVSWIFDKLDATIRKRADYKGRTGAKGFEKLEYDTPIFWQNGTGGGLHHGDFWDLVAQNVTVYQDEVKILSSNELYLQSGEHFPCDVVLCGTGWERGTVSELFDAKLVQRLGLPFPKDEESPESASKWEKLVLDADEMVMKRFPILANPPPHHHVYAPQTPFRLDRGIAPLTDDTIAFMNFVTAGNKLFCAEVQAMWAVAFLDKAIALPSLEEREKRIALWIAWNKRRYLSKGELGSFAAFDTMPYADTLLNDWAEGTKRSNWGSYYFKPYLPPELGNLWKGYLAKLQRNRA